MSKKPFSESEVRDFAEKLAEAIVENAEPNADKMIQLVEAIKAVFGSMEAFYQQVYQHLSKKEMEILGQWLDAEVQRRKKQKIKFATLINSKTFENIIEAFRKVGTGIVQNANHAAPISPVRTGTTAPVDKDRGR